MTNADRDFPILTTPRLTLRALTEQDAPALLEITHDEEVMRYYGMEPFETLDDVLEEIAWGRDLFREGQGIRWAIALRTSDAYIGDLGLHNYSEQHARAEAGYKLARPYWRQGLMSEALGAVVDYGFDRMALNRIEALVDPRNTASWAMLEKLGFRREGVLRDYEHERSGYVDLAMYSLLRREWLSP